MSSHVSIQLYDFLHKLNVIISILDVEGIFEIVTTVLEQKAVCQMDPDQEDEAFEEEEQSEEDSMLVSAAADVVAALASALGPQFAEPFQDFFPMIVKYYVSTTTLQCI